MDLERFEKRDFRVGDKLWYQPRIDLGRQRQGRSVRVESVGRKWVYLSNGERFEIKGDLWCDGGNYSPRGCVFSSCEAYRSESEANKLYRELNQSMVRRPERVTAADIRAAAELLGVSLEDG